MDNQIKNISTGFFLFIGMSVIGFLLGVAFIAILGLHEALGRPVVYTIWGVTSFIGLIRFGAFATSDMETP